MGGPFYTKSHELHYQLKRLGEGFNEFYDNMVCEAIVREHWEEEGTTWVRGTFRASKVEMRTWQAGMSRRTFQRRWTALIEAGIIEENEEDSLDIPRYKKRGQEGIREAEVKIMSQDLQETKQEVGEIKEDIQEIKKILQAEIDPPDGKKPAKKAQRPVMRSRKPVMRSQKVSSGDRPLSFKGLDKKKISLSSLNIVISGFYKGIGQKRISKEKRERGLKVFRKLRKDGFDPVDIAFAVDWTLENAKEEVYDFSIIEHTIGQAIAARDKQESERKQLEERDKAVEEERSQREAEERDREQIEAHKANLGEEKRATLHERAEAEISAAGIYKPGFISEPLIAAKENELLRKELEE